MVVVSDTETLTPTKLDDGITFHVSSLSPFAIGGWYKSTPHRPAAAVAAANHCPDHHHPHDVNDPVRTEANVVKADKTRRPGRHRNADCCRRRYAGADCHGRKRQDGCPDRRLGSKYTFKGSPSKLKRSACGLQDHHQINRATAARIKSVAPFTDVDTAKVVSSVR